MTSHRPHKWSGWPGAFCLLCGEQDQIEICVATHDAGMKCSRCGEIRPNTVCDDPADFHGALAICPEHQNTSCKVIPFPAQEPKP